MINEFALDLKVARRQSGLRQRDCAHLLGISQSMLSDMELGRTAPSVRDICTLSIVYGRSFDSLFEAVLRDARETLPDRLASLPDCASHWRGVINRQYTLNRLADYLAGYSDNDATS